MDHILTIYKYPLILKRSQLIAMVDGAKILSAKVQNDNICLWVLINPTLNPDSTIEIEIFGTGHQINTDPGAVREFIDTCIMPDGLVWHVFKRII